MIERLITSTRPNKLTRTGLAAAIGGTAMFMLAKSEAAHFADTESRPAAVNARVVPLSVHDTKNEIRQLRSQIIRERQQEAARAATRAAVAIPTPAPTQNIAPSPKPTPRVTHTPTALPTHLEAAQPEQYFFGSGRAAKKFAKLGQHAHEIAQLEYTRGKQQGLSNAEIGCEQNLTVMESGNTETARNPSSGAYGLPQALPGSKMASAGSDWETNPTTQLEWMAGYVEARYDGFCGAWSYWLNHNSY